MQLAARDARTTQGTKNGKTRNAARPVSALHPMIYGAWVDFSVWAGVGPESAELRRALGDCRAVVTTSSDSRVSLHQGAQSTDFTPVLSAQGQTPEVSRPPRALLA